MKSKAMPSYPEHNAECDASDLLRAAEVKQDPKRYAAAMAIITKKKKAILSLDDLKAKRAEMPEEEEDEA